MGQGIVPFGFQLEHAEYFALSALFSVKGYKGLKERWSKQALTEGIEVEPPAEAEATQEELQGDEGEETEKS